MMASQSDITVETTSSAQDSKAITKVLLEMVHSLSNLVRNIQQLRLNSLNRFDHLEFLLSRAQEGKASIPRAIPTPVPASFLPLFLSQQ
jgi:hypothetical protein